MHNGEYHTFNPDVVQTLQRAMKSGDYQLWRQYSALVNERPVAVLRDLLELASDREPIPLDQVEPVSAITKRFDSAAMSLGALSPEAHEALAEAMNRLGGRSNSGEGGEDPARFGTDKSLQDQADCLWSLWCYTALSGQCRGAADQGRSGCQAG